jgi:hypothetical protein
MAWRRTVVAAVAAVAATGCAGSAASTTPASTTPASTTSASGPAALRWPIYRHEIGPLDLAGPLRDGSLVLAAGGRLWTLQRDGTQTLFAAAYDQPGNAEPYIAAPSPQHAGCSFGTNTVYVLRLYGSRGVVRVSRHGSVRLFARLRAPGLINGIAFDERGRFGRRLLVTINHGQQTTVEAIDCHGHVVTITGNAPRVEGGIAVPPGRFGRFTGDLIAPDEKSGRIYAITPTGRSALVVRSGLSSGQDIGVESEAFVPVQRHYALLGADRLSPGNPHPGDNALLRIGSAGLSGAGVRAFDLLVGTEGGARLVDVRCGRTCRAREVGAGPAAAHLEGHLGIMPVRPAPRPGER